MISQDNLAMLLFTIVFVLMFIFAPQASHAEVGSERSPIYGSTPTVVGDPLLDLLSG